MSTMMPAPPTPPPPPATQQPALPRGITSVVTGEAVELQLPAAHVGLRILAFALDWFLIMALLTGGIFVLAYFTEFFDSTAEFAQALVVLNTVFFLVLLPAIIEYFGLGRSVGHRATGLRIVRDDGGPVRWRHCLVRSLVGFFELFMTFGLVAFFTAIFNPRCKRLGDFLAGTHAIRENISTEFILPPQMPPELLGWAQRCDIARIPDALAVAARQVLGRSAAMDPMARASLTQHLAAQFSMFVAPQPPMGTPPDRFLAAVLAERRKRHLDALNKQRNSQQTRSRQRSAAPILSPESSQLIGETDPGSGTRPQ